MNLPKIDVNSLIIFYFVASERSISAAADKLFLTQPTVSYHIKSLENNTGVKLLEIKRKKISLTAAGNGLFEYSKEIYRQVMSVEKYLLELREASIRLGISPTFSHTVADSVGRFEEICPHVKLIIKYASSSEVTEMVLNSEVDVGIIVTTNFNHPKVKSVSISDREQLVLVASPSLPIAKKKSVSFTDLIHYQMIAGPEHSATRQIMANAFKNSGYEMPTLTVEVNSVEFGISLVENGKGIGLYHTKAVADKITEGRLKALPFVEEICVGAQAVYRNDSPVNPWVDKILPFIREEFKKK